mgnify:CR=1 FL=1
MQQPVIIAITCITMRAIPTLPTKKKVWSKNSSNSLIQPFLNSFVVPIASVPHPFEFLVLQHESGAVFAWISNLFFQSSPKEFSWLLRAEISPMNNSRSLSEPSIGSKLSNSKLELDWPKLGWFRRSILGMRTWTTIPNRIFPWPRIRSFTYR